jgi:FAD/FMN-containing dehydrogenase
LQKNTESDKGSDMKTDLGQICELMRECGDIMRNADRRSINIDTKCGRANFVTDYDKKVQDTLQRGLCEIVPDARFIGHFSHWYEWGCMLYARFIFPGDKVPPNESEAAALYNAVWDKAIRAAIANGGVINEHHGVGLKLGRYVKDLYGSAMPVLEGVKKQLDPNGIINPGKLGFAGM